MSQQLESIKLPGETMTTLPQPRNDIDFLTQLKSDAMKEFELTFLYHKLLYGWVFYCQKDLLKFYFHIFAVLSTEFVET